MDLHKCEDYTRLKRRKYRWNWSWWSVEGTMALLWLLNIKQAEIHTEILMKVGSGVSGMRARVVTAGVTTRFFLGWWIILLSDVNSGCTILNALNCGCYLCKIIGYETWSTSWSLNNRLMQRTSTTSSPASSQKWNAIYGQLLYWGHASILRCSTAGQ